jgi:hypothetical protein
LTDDQSSPLILCVALNAALDVTYVVDEVNTLVSA